jgi:two-component system, sporulation sensor kinase D
MNYTQKSRWKLALIGGAFLIAGASLYYTNGLVHKVEKEERNKVQLWAEAIQKKARLVKYANYLFNQIGSDEEEKVKLWADATKRIADVNAPQQDFSFLLDVIKNNHTVPVIMVDDMGKPILGYNRNLLDSLKAMKNDTAYLDAQVRTMREQHPPIEINIAKNKKNYLYYSDSKLFTELKVVLNDLVESFMKDVQTNASSVPVILTDSTQTKIMEFGNVDTLKMKDSTYLKNEIADMRYSNPPIEIELPDEGKQYIFYEESSLSKELRYYPYFELGIISLFIMLAYYLFNGARKSEQNRVWVGLAKETAHQLGTPLTSLMAWVEYLKSKNVELTDEMEKDVKRLETITSRFSKIGSAPQLEAFDLVDELKETMDYIRTRSSQKVKFTLNVPEGLDTVALLNPPLFSWVIENLFRNAIDAMGGQGSITMDVSRQTNTIVVDITDTGKGIPKGKFKTVFEPGYTTKSRGWGLGLSLCKRIIDDYHGGKILVKNSEIGKGTTFRIVLKAASKA